MKIGKILAISLLVISLVSSPAFAQMASQAPYEKSYTDEDLYYLSRTMWAEARSEGALGMLHVGSVILNRVKSNKYPKTIKTVVLQPRQFSVWQKSNPNYYPMLRVGHSDPIFVLSEKLAKQLLTAGSINNFLRFEYKSLGKGGVVIGNHRFR